ncbi:MULTISPECIES: hypothetical protein [unclassified Phyllobacterium]|uniref:hypothetical protein n=1 Tax=Phyllobacterium TaxID=28100 RepID=UPI000DD65660|nr:MULTISPECIES: hypothetical protein [unclassified Phyllobacterium]MBA8901388.1 opacity protein-like surface antigen [Phyllobacterium sp. P30BS-XVII]UGX84799.1 hypothetical protein LLE53_009780 [Phyllobacterium sp. T1293]
MIRKLLAGIAFATLAVSSAQAQTCAGNFKTEGIPLITAINYKSWQVFPKLVPKTALSNLAQAVAAEGFSGIDVNKSLGAITAEQEVTGSGRPQTLRVVVRKAGKGSRIDVVFMVAIGQIAPEGTTRTAICRIIAAANG